MTASDAFKGAHTPCFGSTGWFEDKPITNAQRLEIRAEAKRQCLEECPVLDDCRAWVLSGQRVIGTVAGLSESQRRVSRRPSRRKK